MISDDERGICVHVLTFALYAAWHSNRLNLEGLKSIFSRQHARNAKVSFVVHDYALRCPFL
jgi:hypothetical protein